MVSALFWAPLVLSVGFEGLSLVCGTWELVFDVRWLVLSVNRHDTGEGRGGGSDTGGGGLPPTGTGVPQLQENAPPKDPTVGLCLGSSGGPRGMGACL